MRDSDYIWHMREGYKQPMDILEIEKEHPAIVYDAEGNPLVKPRTPMGFDLRKRR